MFDNYFFFFRKALNYFDMFDVFVIEFEIWNLKFEIWNCSPRDIEWHLQATNSNVPPSKSDFENFTSMTFLTPKLSGILLKTDV